MSVRDGIYGLLAAQEVTQPRLPHATGAFFQITELLKRTCEYLRTDVEPLKILGAGTNHTIVLTGADTDTDTPTLYGCGYNYYGQAGIPPQDGKTTLITTPLQVRVPAVGGEETSPRPVKVSVGAAFSAVMTDDGGLYTFGCAWFGRLGHGDGDESPVYVPRRVTTLPRVKDVSCGGRHALLLTEDGRVWSFGLGVAGRLGHGDEQTQREPRPIEGAWSSDVRPTSVSAGNNTSFVVDATGGRTWSFGSGDAGVLGHGDRDDRLVPHEITRLRAVAGRSAVTSISVGRAHVLFLLRSGRVWSCGIGRYGALGCGHAGSTTVPLPSEASLRDVVQVAAGGAHSLFLTRRGEVKGCGSNAYGQLGLSRNDYVSCRVYVPEYVVKSTGYAETDVVAVDAGEHHSLLARRNGDVYSFGRGDDGQLGHGIRDHLFHVGKML